MEKLIAFVVFSLVEAALHRHYTLLQFVLSCPAYQTLILAVKSWAETELCVWPILCK